LANPDPWLVEALSGGKPASGVTVNEKKALQVSTVLACIRILSETVASLPLNVYRRLPGGGKEKAADHVLYPILHDLPNTEMTSFNFREALQGHLGSWGNAYAEIDFDRGGRPKALWPLRPDKTWPERDKKTGKIYYKVLLPDGKGAVLPSERVLHIPGFGFDGLVGYNPITLSRESIGLAKAAEEFGARFFANDARPGVVLEHPNNLSEEAQKRLKKSWEEQYQGLSNKHRIAILEEGMTLKEVGIPPEDAQYLELRKFQVAEIARLYRIPLHLLQEHEKSTSWGSGIEQMNIGFVIHTIRPWLVRWEQVIKWKLIPKPDQDKYFAEFKIDGLLRGDIKSRYEAYAIGRQWGWLAPDDIRELENMNPLPDKQGKIYLVPMNMMPASMAGTPDQERAIRQLKQPEQRRQETWEERAVRAAKSRRRVSKAYKRVFADAAGRVIRREVNDIKKAIDKHLKQRSITTFDAWLEDFYREHQEFIELHMTPVYMSFAEAIKVEVADEIDIEAEMTPEMEEFVRAYLTAYIARHVGSSIGQIRKLLREAEENNEDPAAVLEQRFEEWEEKRPDKIANWETVRASNAFAKAAYIAGGIMKLRWDTFGENCPYCNSLDGKVVGINDKFLEADTEFQPDGADKPLITTWDVGHPPAHEGCDCQITAAW